MSLTHQQRRTYTTECEYCGENYQHGYNEDYCSQECVLSQKGENALRNIGHDHRFCSTCYKPLKVVFRPADDETPELRKKALLIREAFVGFQDFTKYASSGDFGIECECGNTQHYHHEDILRDNEPYEWFLKLAFEKFNAEGQIHQEFSIEVFANTFWETEDLEYSVGKALHDT